MLCITWPRWRYNNDLINYYMHNYIVDLLPSCICTPLEKWERKRERGRYGETCARHVCAIRTMWGESRKKFESERRAALKNHRQRRLNSCWSQKESGQCVKKKKFIYIPTPLSRCAGCPFNTAVDYSSVTTRAVILAQRQNTTHSLFRIRTFYTECKAE